MKNISTYPANTLRVLQKNKEVCGEAFRLICSDDARREGFFRRVGPLTEKSHFLREVQKSCEITTDGVNLQLNGGWLVIYNNLFSIRVSIFLGFSDPVAISDSCLFPIQLEGLRLEDELVRKYIFFLRPKTCNFGDYLEARSGVWEAESVSHWKAVVANGMLDPFVSVSHEIESYSGLNSEPTRFIQEVYGVIFRFYKGNNYEMARIALNLLAEFEAMLDSAIKHFEGKTSAV
ncbi:MAG: hypothetical protein Q7S22_06310 [Candidatus Micrarchaeota archaeon]|nr:hypothetical protein [Candidatus Micrarchaeota archaeon]